MVQEMQMLKLNLTRLNRLTVTALVGTVIIILCGIIVPNIPTYGQSQVDVFEQVWQTVNEKFFDPNFNGLDWRKTRGKYINQAKQAQTKSELATVINQMLSELKTSHTRFYTQEEPAYYQLLGVFWSGNTGLHKQLKKIFPTGKPEYSGIGIITEDVKDKTFVRAVLDGSPAAKAGILMGDQVLQVDGQPFQPIQSFVGKAGKPVTILIQKTQDANSRKQITVTPKLLDGSKMFLDAMDASVKVVERDGKKIGYVHIWSYAGDKYQEKLEQELFSGRIRDADSFVLDLREGWGGASPNYLNIYNNRAVQLTSTLRNQNKYTFNSAWTKPVVMLVNDKSRSGKEILAYGFRKHKIGTIVGTKTPGAVVAGSPFIMKDGNLLYLAVTDVHLDGKERLEGVGVEPDIEVPFSVEYADGADPQKDRALTVAAEAVK